MPPFVINYTPVGHNCDFGCLFDHLRKQLAFSGTSLSLVPVFPTRAGYFAASVHNTQLIFPAVCGAPSGIPCLLCSEPYEAVAQWLLSFKAVPARQEDTQGFHQDAGEAGLVDAA